MRGETLLHFQTIAPITKYRSCQITILTAEYSNFAGNLNHRDFHNNDIITNLYTCIF